MSSSIFRPYVAVAAIYSVGLADGFGQTESTTDPVGLIELSVAGTGTAGAPAKYSFKGLPLTKPVEYQGSAEISTGGSSNLSDNEANWTGNQFNGANAAVTHYLEITSGNSAGTTYDITGTNASTLTLAQPLATSVTNGSAFKIRKHWTIGDVFGVNNEGGLFGGTQGTADQVIIYGDGGVPKTYYYKTTGPQGTGWRSTASISVSEAGRVIYPEDAIVVKRTQSAPVSLVIAGAVKTGQSSYPILVGNNFLANVCATDMTLASSGLYTGNSTSGLNGGTQGTADQVLLWNGAGYVTYYYKTSGPQGTGWRSANSISFDEGTKTIAAGSSIVIIRKHPAGFNWVIPQHPPSL